MKTNAPIDHHTVGTPRHGRDAFHRVPYFSNVCPAWRNSGSGGDSTPWTHQENALAPSVEMIGDAVERVPTGVHPVWRCSLLEEHRVRLSCAELMLDERPLERYGIERHFEEARQSLLNGGILSTESVQWLPDLRNSFDYLRP